MKCPLCNTTVITKYNITGFDKVAVDWHNCICGSIFHALGIDKSYFDEKYLTAWKGMKGIIERYEYTWRTYIPFIEDIIYGRKFLDVGFTLPNNIKHLAKRGWIATGIDLIKNDYINGDFESFEFPDKFDFIHMGHCLESMADPHKALKKAYDTLNNDGLLLITTPNPEMIFTVGLENFGHWEHKEKHIFISKNKLEDMARIAGFDIIFSRRNFSHRFTMCNDLHILLQKRDI